MDVFEHLIMLMIIRREVIHFAIKNQMEHLIGAPEKEDDLNLGDESSESTSFIYRASSINDPDGIGSIQIKDDQSNKSGVSSIFNQNKNDTEDIPEPPELEYYEAKMDSH